MILSGLKGEANSGRRGLDLQNLYRCRGAVGSDYWRRWKMHRSWWQIEQREEVGKNLSHHVDAYRVILKGLTRLKWIVLGHGIEPLARVENVQWLS